jgi:UDP-N-acetylmuramate dehydrogenase
MASLLTRLPKTRGEMRENVTMANHTWFGVGGAADIMFSPQDQDDLAQFLAQLDPAIPVYPVGAGSNLLVRDGGIEGVVINMTTHMNSIEQDGDTLIVGAGLHDADVARAAAKRSLAGLEFLIGIPGTVGGGLRMNAGAYGREFKDIVIVAEAIDRQGNRHRVTPQDMGMAYRHSDAPLDWIFTQATLQAQPGESADIRAKMKEIVSNRADAQPRGVRTGGSTFANPDGHKAWQLIDQAGFRGKSQGEAMVSDKHCNFLINKGNASASDLETLGENVRAAVKAKDGIDLRWEIRRIGKDHPITGGSHD